MDVAAELLRRRVEIETSDLDRVCFPEAGYTKGDLLAYYLAVADVLLPELRDRPLAVHAFPEGLRGEGVHRRDAEGAPGSVRTVKIWAEGSHRNVEVAVGGDLATLVWAVNAGAVAIHPWYSRVTADTASAAPHTFTGSDVVLDRSVLNMPDFVVFDLDPPGGAGTDEAFQAAVEAARLVRDALGDVQLDAFAKTSGKSGVHLYVPIRRQYSFEETRAFAHAIAKELASLHPAHLTTVLAAEKRGGRVFLDVNQNARGRAVAGPYSARPTPEATVSTPVTWDELDYGADPRAFTIATVPGRLRDQGHPWKEMLRRRQALPEDLN